MTAFSGIYVLILLLSLLFSIIYFSYFIVARKQCTQPEILKVSASLIVAAIMLAMISSLLQLLLPAWCTRLLTNLAFFVLIYQFGRNKLRLSRPRALVAVSFPIVLALLMLCLLMILHPFP